MVHECHLQEVGVEVSLWITTSAIIVCQVLRNIAAMYLSLSGMSKICLCKLSFTLLLTWKECNSSYGFVEPFAVCHKMHGAQGLQMMWGGRKKNEETTYQVPKLSVKEIWVWVLFLFLQVEWVIIAPWDPRRKRWVDLMAWHKGVPIGKYDDVFF